MRIAMMSGSFEIIQVQLSCCSTCPLPWYQGHSKSYRYSYRAAQHAHCHDVKVIRNCHDAKVIQNHTGTFIVLLNMLIAMVSRSFKIKHVQLSCCSTCSLPWCQGHSKSYRYSYPAAQHAHCHGVKVIRNHTGTVTVLLNMRIAMMSRSFEIIQVQLSCCSTCSLSWCQGHSKSYRCSYRAAQHAHCDCVKVFRNHTGTVIVLLNMCIAMMSRSFEIAMMQRAFKMIQVHLSCCSTCSLPWCQGHSKSYRYSWSAAQHAHCQDVKVIRNHTGTVIVLLNMRIAMMSRSFEIIQVQLPFCSTCSLPWCQGHSKSYRYEYRAAQYAHCHYVKVIQNHTCTVIVLLNMLIAMMSRSFEIIQVQLSCCSTCSLPWCQGHSKSYRYIYHAAQNAHYHGVKVIRNHTGTVIMLLNMLIAMVSRSFEIIQVQLSCCSECALPWCQGHLKSYRYSYHAAQNAHYHGVKVIWNQTGTVIMLLNMLIAIMSIWNRTGTAIVLGHLKSYRYSYRAAQHAHCHDVKVIRNHTGTRWSNY